MNNCMKEETYTLREISCRLSKKLREDELRFIDRQIKHWTSNDLLRPVGDKHTGTGRSRSYKMNEVIAAAYLHEFSKYGVTIGHLKEFRRCFDFWMKDVALSDCLLGKKGDTGCVVYHASHNNPVFYAIQGNPNHIDFTSHGEEVNEHFSSGLVVNCHDLISPLYKL